MLRYEAGREVSEERFSGGGGGLLPYFIASNVTNKK
jgi:hypothetical protein